MNEREIQNREMDILSVQDDLVIVLDRVQIKAENEGTRPDVLHRSKEQQYVFDKIFKNASQEEVYENTCKQLIPSVTKGYNACVFAYGTTGSGKTYTMIGYDENPGISVLTINDLFQQIHED